MVKSNHLCQLPLHHAIMFTIQTSLVPDHVSIVVQKQPLIVMSQNVSDHICTLQGKKNRFTITRVKIPCVLMGMDIVIAIVIIDRQK